MTQAQSDRFASVQIRENFAAKASFYARSEAGMRVFEDSRYLRVDCGRASDTFNTVVARDFEADQAEGVARENLAHFEEKGFPLAFWLWESQSSRWLAQVLEGLGLLHTETDVAMMADLRNPVATSDLPAGFEIERVQRPAQLRIFGDLLAGLFGDLPEAAQVAAYYRSLSPPAANSESMRLYLGRFRGRPVSTGALFLDGRCAGVYDLATLQPCRRRGFGTGLFAHLLCEARRLGYRTGVLQASPDGLEIYRRAGFRTVCPVRIFENAGA